MEQNEANKLVVPYSKRSKVKLEDGAEIWLNSGPVLKLPTHFLGGKREVSPKGEMYVEVAADNRKPFIVYTAYLDVQVYGIRSNVSAYEDEAVPSCVLADGIVEFWSESGPEIRMKANEKVLYDGRQCEKRKASASRYTRWKEGYLELDDANMVDILNRIGRYYNLSFNFGDKKHLTGKRCSGKIYLSDNIDDVLMTIPLLYSTDYRKEERTTFISENPQNGRAHGMTLNTMTHVHTIPTKGIERYPSSNLHTRLHIRAGKRGYALREGMQWPEINIITTETKHERRTYSKS